MLTSDLDSAAEIKDTKDKMTHQNRALVGLVILGYLLFTVSDLLDEVSTSHDSLGFKVGIKVLVGLVVLSASLLVYLTNSNSIKDAPVERGFEKTQLKLVTSIKASPAAFAMTLQSKDNSDLIFIDKENKDDYIMGTKDDSYMIGGSKGQVIYKLDVHQEHGHIKVTKYCTVYLEQNTKSKELQHVSEFMALKNLVQHNCENPF